MGDGRGSPFLVEVMATTTCQWVSQGIGQSPCMGSSPCTDQTVSSSVADASVVKVQDDQDHNHSSECWVVDRDKVGRWSRSPMSPFSQCSLSEVV